MGDTIVLGIGNRLGGDDSAGCLVVDMLNQRWHKAKPPLSAEVTPIIIGIDAGSAPESYTSVIRQHRPELLILVDAADMGLPAGALRIIPLERISILSFSTHYMPLSMFVSYVREFCGKVVLVGVQPERAETGGQLSEAVRKSAKQLAKAILEGRIAEIPLLE